MLPFVFLLSFLRICQLLFDFFHAYLLVSLKHPLCLTWFLLPPRTWLDVQNERWTPRGEDKLRICLLLGRKIRQIRCSSCFAHFPPPQNHSKMHRLSISGWMYNTKRIFSMLTMIRYSCVCHLPREFRNVILSKSIKLRCVRFQQVRCKVVLYCQEYAVKECHMIKGML